MFSAFTVAELGEMLPSGILFDGNPYGIEMWTFGEPKQSAIQYEFTTDEEGSQLRVPVNAIVDVVEADARAKMLIYLLENKLVK